MLWGRSSVSQQRLLRAERRVGCFARQRVTAGQTEQRREGRRRGARSRRRRRRRRSDGCRDDFNIVRVICADFSGWSSSRSHRRGRRRRRSVRVSTRVRRSRHGWLRSGCFINLIVRVRSAVHCRVGRCRGSRRSRRSSCSGTLLNRRFAVDFHRRGRIRSSCCNA